MKKTYSKPIMTVVGVNTTAMICVSLTNTGNAKTSGIKSADSRRLSFDDEDEEFNEMSLDEFFRNW